MGRWVRTQQKDKTCKEEDCEKPAHCKGLCRRHSDRKYYLGHLDHVKKLTKDWREANSERHKKNQQNWNATEKGKATHHRNNRSLRSRFSQLNCSARRRKIQQDLTFEQYKKIVADNKCYYCPNVLPEVGSGLDRQDHNLNYTLGNVVPCCTSCNDKKGHLEIAGLKYSRTVQILVEILETEKENHG